MFDMERVKMLSKKVKGSITTEAALLIPIVNVLLIAILIISMMYHDRCVVREITEQVIITNKGKQKSEIALSKEILAATNNQLLGSRVNKILVDIGVTDIKAQVFLDNPWLGVVLGDSYDTSVKVIGYKTKGAGVVRLFDVVVNKIKELGW